jgi:hypothetical protein
MTDDGHELPIGIIVREPAQRVLREVDILSNRRFELGLATGALWDKIAARRAGRSSCSQSNAAPVVASAPGLSVPDLREGHSCVVVKARSVIATGGLPQTADRAPSSDRQRGRSITHDGVERCSTSASGDRA